MILPRSIFVGTGGALARSLSVGCSLGSARTGVGASAACVYVTDTTTQQVTKHLPPTYSSELLFRPPLPRSTRVPPGFRAYPGWTSCLFSLQVGIMDPTPAFSLDRSFSYSKKRDSSRTREVHITTARRAC